MNIVDASAMLQQIILLICYILYFMACVVSRLIKTHDYKQLKELPVSDPVYPSIRRKNMMISGIMALIGLILIIRSGTVLRDLR